MKAPDWLRELIRLTRRSDGRKSHWSLSVVLWLQVRSRVPLTSAGHSKVMIERSPSPGRVG